MAERLVTKEEYNSLGAVKKFVKILRARGDPPPRCLAPPRSVSGGKQKQCVQNAARYAEVCGGTPILGFKIWKLELPNRTDYVAAVHAVVRCDGGDNYIDVTPSDAGDEGQSMIFVPSSLIYPAFSAGYIAKLAESGLEPRMGMVSGGYALDMKRLTEGDLLHKSTPGELNLWLAPKLSTIKRVLGVTKTQLEGVNCDLSFTGRCLVEASTLLTLAGETLTQRAGLGDLGKTTD